MKISGKIMAALCISAACGIMASAGDIEQGSVPGSLNYQGRLERDNAPITGLVHLTFRIYNAPTGGDPALCGQVNQPCRYQSPEQVVTAAQGIFSASITPPISVFARTGQLYLEVQVESDVLSPREPLSSVAYAMVAKKLEDGANVSVASFTAAYQVALATAVGNNVGIGTSNPSSKLTVNGTIEILPGGGILFPDDSVQVSAGVGSAGNISTALDANIIADNDSNGTGGGIIFSRPLLTYAAITSAGDMGIGAAALAAPMGKLDVDGSFYVGSQGIHDRTGGPVNIIGDLAVSGGRVTGANSEYLTIGESDNIISLVSGGSERMRVHTDGNVGVGLAAPSANLHVAGDILTNTGARANGVSIGAYTGWTSAANEVRAQTGQHLLLQQNSSYNVGVGTDSPKEKLHVRGSIRSDYGVIAATASFSGPVNISGDFTANSGLGNKVYLSSTVIYGTLVVTGGVGSDQGMPGYLASTQTFTGQNTFTNPLVGLSDIRTVTRAGAGVIDFDFPTVNSRYLQIGDKDPAFVNDNAAAYIVGGGNADSRIYFYRGDDEAARFETQAGNNLALVIGNNKSLVNGTYYNIYNSVVWISTGYATTPAIYVSSSTGNVGIGTAVSGSAYRLTVEGNIRISTSSSPGQSYGLIFADGTTLNSASYGGSAGAISNNDTALVQSDTDLNGSGNIILRAGSVDALVVTADGRVGVGVLDPGSKFNLRGGDLVVGNPSIVDYIANGYDDLIVGGNLVVDRGIIQRSAIPVAFSAMTVAGNVYLSTAAAAGTRIGSDAAPAYKLDVTGDINASGALRTAGVNRISAAGVVGLAGSDATWDGATIAVNRGGTGVATLAANGVLYGNDAAAVNVTAAGAQYQVLRVNASGTPVFGAVNLAQSAAVTGLLPVDNGGTGSDLAAIDTGGLIYKSGAATIGGTAALTGVLKGNGAGAPSALTGTAGTVARWTDANTIGLSTVTDNGTEVGVGGPAAAGTKLYVYGKLRTGTFQMATGATLNYVLTSDINGNGTWQSVDTFSGDPLIGNEVTDAANTTLTRSGTGSVMNPYKLALNLDRDNTWTGTQTLSGGVGLTGVLKGNGTSALTAGDVNLTTEVTGTLPVGNGGTGLASGSAGKVVCWINSSTMGRCNSAVDATGGCTCVAP